MKENGLTLEKVRSRRYSAKTITDVDYADNIALLANILAQAEFLLHSPEKAAGSIGFHINADKTEYVSFKVLIIICAPVTDNYQALLILHYITYEKYLIKIQINVGLSLKIWVLWTASAPIIADSGNDGYPANIGCYDFRYINNLTESHQQKLTKWTNY